MIKHMPLFVRQKWMTHSSVLKKKHTHAPSVIHTLIHITTTRRNMYLAGKKAGSHTHNIKAQGIANVEDALKDDL